MTALLEWLRLEKVEITFKCTENQIENAVFSQFSASEDLKMADCSITSNVPTRRRCVVATRKELKVK